MIDGEVRYNTLAGGLPPGYLSNFTYDDNTILIKRTRRPDYGEYGGDELRIIGNTKFDMTVKLPPLPAGEWEVRMGTDVYPGEKTRNAAPEALQFYIDGEPMGGTVNFYVFNGDAEWIEGPLYYHALIGNPPTHYPLRYRRVIGRFTTDGKSDHYLRLDDTMETIATRTLKFDYLEFCPVKDGKVIVDD